MDSTLLAVCHFTGSGAAGNLKSKFENLAREQEEVCSFLSYIFLTSPFLKHRNVLLLICQQSICCRKTKSEQKRKRLADKLENKERKRSMRKGRQRYETKPLSKFKPMHASY